jgi:protein SCO1/2
MTDSENRSFDSRSLAGTVWIVDFIYTNCPAECPRMSAQMHKIEQQIAGDDSIRLVSVSVDPARDTPPVLENFARRFGGATEHWIFLTGTPESIHKVAYDTFHVGDVIGKIEHSTKFVLVDKQGRIRGYYSSFDPDSLAALVKDAKALEGAAA